MLKQFGEVTHEVTHSNPKMEQLNLNFGEQNCNSVVDITSAELQTPPDNQPSVSSLEVQLNKLQLNKAPGRDELSCRTQGVRTLSGTVPRRFVHLVSQATKKSRQLANGKLTPVQRKEPANIDQSLVHRLP